MTWRVTCNHQPVLRNNSRGDGVRVERLQRPPDSGMMSACCRWRERSAPDVLRLVVSFFCSSSAIRAKNLVLRKQLASYIERRMKPRRLDHATRASLALFTRLFDWRDTVVNVQPATRRESVVGRRANRQ